MAAQLSLRKIHKFIKMSLHKNQAIVEYWKVFNVKLIFIHLFTTDKCIFLQDKHQIIKIKDKLWKNVL